MGEKKDKGNIFEKLKKIKHIEIITVVIAIILVGIIVFGNFTGQSDKLNDVTLDYASIIESKLEKVLSSIDGAGSVSVMVMTDGNPEIIIAKSIEEKKNTSNTSSGSTENITTVETPILISKNGVTTPLVLQEIPPKILGVLIVCKGAANIKVRLELITAVQSLLKIDVSCIEVLVGK